MQKTVTSEASHLTPGAVAEQHVCGALGWRRVVVDVILVARALGV